MAQTILVVDDDIEITLMLKALLERQQYRVETAHNGQTGLEKVSKVRPDLVLLDVMMPGMDGWEVCRRLRQETDVPVIMLTAKSLKDDVVKGLRVGADDYIAKPFSGAELQARIKAVLRRVESQHVMKKQTDSVYSDGYLSVDLATQVVTVKGRPVDLTPIELKLLSSLVRNQGSVLSNRQLFNEVWESEQTQDIGYVDLYIHYLRSKIEPNPSNPKYILQKGDKGYRFS